MCRKPTRKTPNVKTTRAPLCIMQLHVATMQKTQCKRYDVYIINSIMLNYHKYLLRAAFVEQEPQTTRCLCRCLRCVVWFYLPYRV